MKILFVIGSLRVGGAELQLVMLIKGLVQKGVECRVFSMEGDGPLAQEISAVGVPVIDGGYRSGPGRIWLLRQLSTVMYRLLREIKREPCEVLHAYLPMANFIGTVAGRIRRVPCVFTSKRALGTHRVRSRLWHIFDYISNYFCHRVIVNSTGVWDDASSEQGMSVEKLILIHNGIDARRFQDAATQRNRVRASLGLDGDDLAITMLANLIPYKGHSDALTALSMAREQGLIAKMLMVGDDRGTKKDLDQQAKALGIDKSVLWLGKREDVPSLLSASDIGLIASHEEGFCNALLEMMASGLPVVATRVGGNSEALGQGKLGVLVDSRAPKQMAEALGSLAGDPELRMRLGKLSAQEVQARYSVDGMVSKFLDLYALNCNQPSNDR